MVEWNGVDPLIAKVMRIAQIEASQTHVIDCDASRS